MIIISNVEISNISRAIYSARNAMNSWGKSDSDLGQDILGSNDLALAKKLAKAGTDHRKFMRMITVYVDITAPRYWWAEFDTYKVGTVANSCSTMHKIHEKEFTLDDFSCEHLDEDVKNDYLLPLIDGLNIFRANYINTKDKCYWWQMIQLLPQSYNQKRTVMLNYEVLANIYHSRQHHKLDEWNVDYDGSFCQWIKTLPYNELITGEY